MHQLAEDSILHDSGKHDGEGLSQLGLRLANPSSDLMSSIDTQLLR
jgi:hypothetical protein